MNEDVDALRKYVPTVYSRKKNTHALRKVLARHTFLNRKVTKRKETQRLQSGVSGVTWRAQRLKDRHVEMQKGVTLER